MAVEQAVNKAADTAKGVGSYALTTFKTLAPLGMVFLLAGATMGGGAAALVGKAGADIGAIDLMKVSWEGVTEVGGAAMDIIRSGVTMAGPHLAEATAAASTPAP